MLIGAVAFSIMGSLAHGLKHELDWQVIALTRAAIPCVLVLIYSCVKGLRLVLIGTPLLWMRSLTGSLSLLAVFYSLTRLPTSDVLTLTNLFPIWVALLSWPLLGEKPGKVAWIGLVCSIIGVILIQQPHFQEGNYAVFVAFSASLTTALAMIGLNRLKGVDSREIVFHFSSVAVIVAFATWWICHLFHFSNLLAGEKTEVKPGNLTIDLLMLFGVGVAALTGQFCLTNAFKLGPATQVSVVGLSQVGFAMLIDMFVWGRQFNLTTLLGIALVLGPTAWLLWTGRKAKLPEITLPVTGIDPD